MGYGMFEPVSHAMLSHATQQQFTDGASMRAMTCTIDCKIGTKFVNVPSMTDGAMSET